MITNKSVQDAATELASGNAILIDVREPYEFKTEHIPYALSLPLGQVTDLFKKMNIPGDKKIYVQCAMGGRSAKACIALSKEDCPNEIYNIDGGIQAWKAENLPLISGNANTGISIFRQVQIIVGALVLLMVILGFSGISAAFVVAGILGAALCFAGITGWCGLALLLTRMPWNK